MAFTPLDVAVSDRPHARTLLIFLLLGMSFFTSALILERTRTHVA